MVTQYNSRTALRIAFAALLLALPPTSHAQDDSAKNFSPEQIKAGSDIYSRNCSACHGPRMLGPEAFDLRKFPRDQHTRFITSVTKGKNSMPPWGGLLSVEDIESLWAYVMAGEKP
jgi:mono/diheme cytochrome c family protein